MLFPAAGVVFFVCFYNYKTMIYFLLKALSYFIRTDCPVRDFYEKLVNVLDGQTEKNT